MAYQVLALRFRPTKLSEVIGQNHIVRSLQNSLSLNRFGQAYLFTGTRGVGKTSVARIFAKSLRCLARMPNGDSCGECLACQSFQTESSLDILEIDGASCNSVDNVRDIIAGSQYVPALGERKIYIIDEVHMLSISAFNALLKILEEPPLHVVFIFATTEPQKIPDTITSRCQQYDFKSVSLKDLEQLVTSICQQEKIKFSSPLLIKNLCKLGEGSIRDTLSYLEQVVGYSFTKEQDFIEITSEKMTEALGLAGNLDLENLWSFILKEDSYSAHQKYQELLMNNVSPSSVLLGLIELIGEQLKAMTVAKEIPAIVTETSTSLAELFWLYEVLAKDFTWATQNTFSYQVIDLLIQKVTLRKTFKNQQQRSAPVNTISPVAVEVSAPIPVSLSALAPLAPAHWDDFMAFLYKKSPASASYLEQGNILVPVAEENEKLMVKIGFPLASKIFFEYLGDSDSLTRLKKNLADFYQKDEKNVLVELKLMTEAEGSIASKVEIEEKKKQEGQNLRQDEFLNNPMVKLAQNLFEAKIDKVILN